MTISIERMKSEYLDNVIDLGLSTPELRTGTNASQFYSKKTLTNWIKSEKGILLTAMMEDNFAGFSITAYNPDSRDGYIHFIAIKEKYRRMGIASKLLTYTLDELEKLGCNHVYSLVNMNNENTKKFFKNHNFEIGETFSYVQRTLP